MKRKLKISTIRKELLKEKKQGRTIGFVPTMGALHDGHASLIRKAKRKCDIVVCSIFVNPKQFNEKKDLRRYPRTLRRDMEILEKEGVEYLFHPSIEEIYPKGESITVDLDLMCLDKRMEGKFRPGHFKGVVQVVKRLLDIIQPSYLFMGQKDFQQFTIIQYMIDTLDIPTTLIVCVSQREKDGLAMSSRNRRLDPKLRKRAGIIYETLKMIKRHIDDHTPQQLIKKAINGMTIPGFKPEYVSIIDGKTLKPIQSFKTEDYIVACTAVWAGEVRLIDNIILKNDHTPTYT